MIVQEGKKHTKKKPLFKMHIQVWNNIKVTLPTETEVLKEE